MKKIIGIIFIISIFIITGCENSLSKPFSENNNAISGNKAVITTPSPEPVVELTPRQTETTKTSSVETQTSQAEPEINEQVSQSIDEITKIEVETYDETIPVMVNTPSVSEETVPNYDSPSNESGTLSNKKIGWYFSRNKDGLPPSAPKDFDISQFGGYYLGDTSKKIIYLTFDEGYENGYTEKILDVLKEKDAKAAFFVTQTYIRDNIELIKRMAEEGHLVCNHSVKHKSFPSLSDDEIISELKGCEDYFKEVTGYEMPKFFRPPMGEYSARVLDVVNKQGYKTIFWSFAHVDWLVDDQPSVETAYQRFIKDLHNGSIPLLHAVSSANTGALPRIIDSARELGYEFATLNELP